MDIIQGENRTEVYRNAVERETALYIESLPDESLILKVGPFRALLQHIADTVFKADTITNANTDRNINYDDIDELRNIWRLYTRLSYTFNHNISIQGFCLFSGINYDTIMSWYNSGNVNNINSNDVVLNTMCDSNSNYINKQRNAATRRQIIKEWKTECESNLSDHASHDNSIGSIFILKSVYGYAESPQRIEVSTNTDTVDRAALMDKYKDQERPQLPDNSDNSDDT